MAEDQNEKRGVTCSCGHYEPFSVYVHAHWDERLTYTCDKCQAVYNVRAGRVTPVRKPPRKTRKDGKR